MSPYQHLFSANAVLNVWRNLRNTRDQNDLLLTFQYHPDDVRNRRFGEDLSARKGPEVAIEERDGYGARGTAVGAGLDKGKRDGRSIGFVVPWRSMKAQERVLKEREKDLAEALVVLAGEMDYTELPDTLKTSLTLNPLIQIRHLAAGLSRQMSKVELQMADNAAFARGKNLYTGGEIARKFLPPITSLFEQRPVPQRMIFELLMELKDLVFAGMVECNKEVLEWELGNFGSLEEVDDLVVKAITPLPPDPNAKLLKRKESLRKLRGKETTSQPTLWLLDQEELLYHLESLETTSAAMTHLTIPDFCAKSAITLRRMVDRNTLNQFGLSKKKRTGRCAEYARCMKWAGNSWRQGGGCRRGCKNEDEDPEGLPSWHSTSKHFDRTGTFMIGHGMDKEVEEEVLKLKS